jgi:hypothetical protein
VKPECRGETVNGGSSASEPDINSERYTYFPPMNVEVIGLPKAPKRYSKARVNSAGFGGGIHWIFTFAADAR